MDDFSLDDYIQQKGISLSLNRIKAPLAQNNGTKVIRPLKRQNTGVASSKNHVVQAKRPFDARQRLNLSTSEVQQKQDARVKLVTKNLVQDARQKIAQKAIVISPQDNISQVVDARAKLNNMQFMPRKEEFGSNLQKQNIQMSFGNFNMNAKSDISLASNTKEVTLKNLGRSLVKTVTNDAVGFPMKNSMFNATKTFAVENQPTSSPAGRKVSNFNLTSTVKTEIPQAEEKIYVSPLQSFRVIVNNLGPNVTYDDIEELFTSCGPMRKVRMTKPGSAEVFYVNIESAYEAVEEYHNRELDDKPMSVALAFLQDKDKLNETKPLRSKKQLTVMKQSLDIDPSVINQAVFRANSYASVVDFTVHL